MEIYLPKCREQRVHQSRTIEERERELRSQQWRVGTVAANRRDERGREIGFFRIKRTTRQGKLTNESAEMMGPFTPRETNVV